MGMVGLGDLPDSYFSSSATGVSADGQVIVGYGSSVPSGTGWEAFRWTPTNGMQALGDLAGGNFDSRAWGVSADGSVIVGESSSSDGNQAFRWTTASGMVGLGDLTNGNFSSIAYGVSADGSTVVGYGSPDSSGTHEAFRWTAETGMVGLGFLPCDTWTIARAVSGDGSIIVGDPQISTYKCVFVWDARHGLRELLSVLTNDYGLDLTGWQLGRATAITPDGKVIVGYGSNPSGQTEGWIANLTPPSLVIRRASGSVVLSWPTNAPGFTLQTATNLVSPAYWADSPATPGIVGADFTITNAASGSSRSYRLHKP
jgi:probable HAF family extracellular repeat protein